MLGWCLYHRTQKSIGTWIVVCFHKIALILRGPNLNHATSSPNENGVGLLSDFLVGFGLDLLLELLAQNSPNGHASVNPPAHKVEIEAMASVINLLVRKKMQCIICLEDLEMGSEVCRFRMPDEDSTIEANLELGYEGNQNSEIVRI